MEELRPTGRRRSRGQLILVAAVTMAIIFLALGVITNAAIFTQNLASRGDTSGGDEALEIRDEIETAVTGMLREVSGTAGSPDPSSLSASVDNYGDVRRFHAGASNALLHVSYHGDVDGVYVADRGNASDPEDGWSDFGSAPSPVVAGVSQVRAFEMNVDRLSLVGSADELDDSSVDEFTVEFVAAGPSHGVWRVQFGNQGGGYGIKVVRDHDPSASGETTVGTCFVSASKHPYSFPVNVTAATVGGEDCGALSDLWDADGAHALGDDIGAYSIEIENGGEAEGTYQFVADETVGWTGAASDEDDPEAHETLYSVEIEYLYNSSSTGYKNVIRVAPGEPDEN